ncbi:MAG TPA: hypothetical protein VJ001_18245 [Rhodocyclaceae bacterium]|nr:hypothetical protein [Rhodocyclaceae bacterium]
MGKTMLDRCRKPGWRGGLGFAILAGVVLLAWELYDWYAFDRQTQLEARALEKRALEARRPLVSDSPSQEDRAYWDAYAKSVKNEKERDFKNYLLLCGMKDENTRDWQKYLSWCDIPDDMSWRYSSQYIATFPEGVQTVWPQQVLTKDGKLFDQERLLQRRLGHSEPPTMKPGLPYLLKLGAMDKGWEDVWERRQEGWIGVALWSNGSLEMCIYHSKTIIERMPNQGDPYKANKLDALAEFKTDQFGILHDVIDLQSGGGFHLALRRDGSVWVIDGLDYGRKRRFDRPVAGLNDVKAIAAGRRHALALKNDGSVWGWQEDVYENRRATINVKTINLLFNSVPHRVENLHDVIKIAATDTTSLALTKDGAVWSWGGLGECGEHGVEKLPVEYRVVERPFRIPNVNDIVDIAAGSSQVMALKRDGTVWRWGNDYNHNSSIGLSADRLKPDLNFPYASSCPNKGDRATPVHRLKRLDQVKQIFAGYRFSAVVRQDGSVWHTDRDVRFGFPRPEFDSVRVMGQTGRLVDIHVDAEERDYEIDRKKQPGHRRGRSDRLLDFCDAHERAASRCRSDPDPEYATSRLRAEHARGGEFPEPLDRRKDLHSEIGLFQIDDAAGRIGNLLPGDSEYAQAALAPERAITLYDPTRTNTGAPKTSSLQMLRLEGGQMLGFYLIDGGNLNSWRSAQRRKHFFEKLKRSSHPEPKVYFSFPAANLDGNRYFDLQIEKAGAALVWSKFESAADRTVDRTIVVTVHGVLDFDERFLPRPPLIRSD